MMPCLFLLFTLSLSLIQTVVADCTTSETHLEDSWAFTFQCADRACDTCSAMPTDAMIGVIVAASILLVIITVFLFVLCCCASILCCC